jgi:hypothetical protein
MPGLLLLLSLSLLAGEAQRPRVDEADAVIWGQVRSERTGAPLRLAMVEVVGLYGQTLLAETDTNGIYILHGVPRGRRLIRATHMDHASHEVELLIVGERQVLDFDLELRPLRLPTVNAQSPGGMGTIRDTLSLGMPELSAATVKALESSPGMAELGLAETPRDVPGYEPLDPSDVLFVRGGAADLKLVLLNGAPVYAPFHIGGLIQALDADVLRSATLHLGGAPARYDGGLSYVMDMETRAGRPTLPHGRMAMDMLAGNAAFEGPVGSRVVYLLSGRAVHGYGTGPFFTSSFPYGYRDGIGRVDIALSDSSGITLSGFTNRESVLLDTMSAFDQTAEWGNDAASARYRGRFRGTDMQFTFGTGEFRTELPLGGTRPLLTEGIAERSRLTADFERALGPGRIFFGASREELGFEYRASSRGLVDSLLVRSRADADVTGGYIDGAINVLDRVRLRAGLRADHFSLDSSVRVAPRLSATVLLTSRATLTVAGGQFRQYVRPRGSSLVLVGTPVPDSAGGKSLLVAEATHLVLALAQDLGEGIRLGLEGFYKSFDNLPSVESGEAEASGVDLWVRRGAGNYRGWLSYSLAWVWSERDTERRSARNFAGRHLISAGVSGPAIAGGNFDVRVSYGAGLPYTAIPEPEVAAPVFSVLHNPVFDAVPTVPSVPSDPDQPYLRIDAEFERTWNAQLADRAFTVTPYVKVLNALNRRDALFYHFDRESSGAEPLAGLPLLPVFGVEWAF